MRLFDPDRQITDLDVELFKILGFEHVHPAYAPFLSVVHTAHQRKKVITYPKIAEILQPRFDSTAAYWTNSLIKHGLIYNGERPPQVHRGGRQACPLHLTELGLEICQRAAFNLTKPTA